MSRRRKKLNVSELSDPSYLSRFGVECARKVAPEMRSGGIGFGMSMPLDDLRVANFINKTVRVMNGAGKLDWSHTSTDRQDIFLQSMYAELQRLGVAPDPNTPHSRDSDCSGHVDRDTRLCSVCGVLHGDPCPQCRGRGYHKSGCPESDG